MSFGVFLYSVFRLSQTNCPFYHACVNMCVTTNLKTTVHPLSMHGMQRAWGSRVHSSGCTELPTLSLGMLFFLGGGGGGVVKGVA